MLLQMCTDLIINVHAFQRPGNGSLGEQGFSATLQFPKTGTRSICGSLFRFGYLIRGARSPQPANNDRFSADMDLFAGRREVEIKAADRAYG
jgi:hypothetical protein